jgi:hypothetical protein
MFQAISQRMPQDNPRTLSEENYLDVLAYILSVNKFAAGSAPLTADAEALAGIRVVRREPPSEAPNYSLVNLVGCVAQNGTGWAITRGSTPRVTKNPDASAGADLQAAQAEAAGAGTFRLVLLTVGESVVKPLAGRRVEAKGILIRATAGNSLNVTSIQDIGGACD